MVLNPTKNICVLQNALTKRFTESFENVTLCWRLIFYSEYDSCRDPSTPRPCTSLAPRLCYTPYAVIAQHSNQVTHFPR